MNKKIDLIKYRGERSSLFTGRPQGQAVRSELKLDEIDAIRHSSIEFVIPAGTTSFNPSFFLGLLFKSFKVLGKRDFMKKYTFDLSRLEYPFKKIIKEDIENGIRHAENSLDYSTGFKEFI